MDFCESIKILADQILLIEIVPDSTYDENVPIRPFNKFGTSLVAIYSSASKALASWIKALKRVLEDCAVSVWV